MDYSLRGSSVHGILQARILEQVAIPFSRESSPPRDRTQLSCTTGKFFTIWAKKWLKAPEAFKKIIYFKINYGGDLSSLYAGKP